MNKRQEAGEIPQDEVEALGMDVTAKVCCAVMDRIKSDQAHSFCSSPGESLVLRPMRFFAKSVNES